MGADIHFVIERKVKDEWVGIVDSSALPIAAFLDKNPDPVIWLQCRDYNFFASLASVRGFGRPPNGLPNDISPLTRMILEAWGEDAHSFCHYSLYDFVHMKMQHADNWTQEIKKQITKGENPIIQKINNSFVLPRATTDENTRAIIWFDN